VAVARRIDSNPVQRRSDSLMSGTTAPAGAPWARALLGAFGWRVHILPPPVPKAVVLFYPHTSNWDFPIGILGRAGCGIPLHWVGKHTLFRWPVRGLMHRWGGIPVDRAITAGMVETLREQFATHESFYVAFSPEGTRKRTESWRTGFYRLALAANVPVGLGYFDYSRRVVGIDTWLTLSGDRDSDLAQIEAGYRGKIGRRPANAGPIRFAD